MPARKFQGYVTTFSAVVGLSSDELERQLGFNASSLKTGYLVYGLIAPIRLGEFEWKDRTRYSGGWHYDRYIDEFVQRQDELRAQLGKQYNYSEKATDQAIAVIMKSQLAKLNARSGPERIVKVVPNSRVSGYPDSPRPNVSQWRLTVLKDFVLLAAVAPGQKLQRDS